MDRRERLEHELLEARVIGNLQAEDETPQAQVVEELEYAVYPRVHEGKTPTYGCIVTQNELDFSTHLIDTARLSIDIARQLANGITTFAVRDRAGIGNIVSFTTPHDSEASLMALRSQFGAVLVHRGVDGVVRVLNRRGMFLRSRDTWSRKPYYHEVLDLISECVPMTDREVLAGLLNFCFHTLSPSRTGATLVWWLREPSQAAMNARHDLSSTQLNAARLEHFGALQGLLQQHDGATCLRRDGKVISLGAHLRYSDNAMATIASEGGTRHTSAKMYSHDERGVLVLVVSEDGTVSVYSDGAKLTELHTTPLLTTGSA